MNRSCWCCLWLLASLSAGTLAYAQELRGTLFTSPEERAYLDYLRQDFLDRNHSGGFDITETEVPAIPQEQVAAVAPREYQLGGIMTRRDGSRTVWLNGQTIAEADLPPGIRIVDAAGVLALRLSSNSGTYLLRPGQSVELLSGLIQEQYQRPRPATEPPAAAVSPAPDTSVAAPVANSDASSIDAQNPAGASDAAPAAAEPTSDSSIVSNVLISGLPVTLEGNQASAPAQAAEQQPSQPELDTEKRMTEILDAIQDLQDEIDARL